MTDRDLAEASEPDSRGYRIPGENLQLERKYSCSRCQATELIWKFKDYNAETKKAKWCLHTIAGIPHRCNPVPTSAPPLQPVAQAVRNNNRNGARYPHLNMPAPKVMQPVAKKDDPPGEFRALRL